MPSAPPPRAGEFISFRVEGLAPYKDEHFSIRNPRHKIYARFCSLREASIRAMVGRAPYRGAIGLDFVMHAPAFEKSKRLADYTDGIMDTLDGSSGVEFTYLPVAYQDDCQVCEGMSRFQADTETFYEVRVRFL